MNKGSKIKDFAYSIASSVLYRMKKTIVYYNGSGIKAINPVYKQISYKSKTVFILKKEELFLDPDYLIDEYTLLGQPIHLSPHYKLMCSIRNGENILDTEYAKRFVSGRLDGRVPGYLGSEYVDLMKNMYQKRYEEILSREYKPVCVYKHLGKYYIYDGKHRAAMCAMLDCPIRCIEIENVNLQNKLAEKKRLKMNKHEQCFRKTLSFFCENE